MKVLITKNYLVFPTNKYAKTKKLCFFSEGKKVYSLDISYDNQDPDFYAYIDVRRFKGQNLSLEISPNMPISYTETDELEGEYNDSLRPRIHFSTKRGWINDPNGLVKVGDKYHLFYQHNPASRTWGNMHWGHAVSLDLFHWKELPEALFPDESGTMFSGCAIIDERNVSKLGSKTSPAILLFYTAAGNPFTICLAYSTDNLQTIRKYELNPIIGHIIDANRDPKVVWCEELNAYVMSLFLVGEQFVLFKSSDLLNWTEIQRITIPNDSECPAFFPITATNGEKKWVFVGAHEVYFVGDFVDGIFQPCQDCKRMWNNSNSYAAQMYTDMADGRVIRLPWLCCVNFCGKTFSQQLGVPTDVQLEYKDGEYYMSYYPSEELMAVTKERKISENVSLSMPIRFSVGNTALGVELKGKWVSSGTIKISCYGVDILLDFSKNEVSVCGSVNNFSINRNELDIKLIIDHSGIEVFCDGGKIAFATCNERSIPDMNMQYVEISSDCDYEIKKLTIEEYECTWEK